MNCASHLSPEMEQLRATERAEWNAWLAGDRGTPIKLMRHEPAYCVCDVIFPTQGHWISWYWRNFLAGLAHMAPLSRWKVFLYRRVGITIGQGVYIAPQVTLDPFQPGLIVLEDGCFLGLGCRLLAHDYTATFIRFGRITVKQGAMIGAYSTVRGGVTVGEKATVGGHSFVCKDVAAGTTVGGVPAKPLNVR